MAETKNKMSFFKRLKTAIFNLEEYGIFIEEKFSVAVKYMLLIILFISLAMSAIITYEVSIEIKKGLSYIENEFPDFTIENHKLKVNEYVEAYDEEYGIGLIVDTNPELDRNKIDDYIEKSKQKSSIGLIILNDKIIYRMYDQNVEYSIRDITKAMEIDDATKSEVLQQFYNIGGTKSVVTMYMIIETISLVLYNIFQIVTDCILVGFIGIIIARICGIAIRGSVAWTLAIYSLTVPVICSFIYGIVLNLTGFEIKYFQIMYLMIAYVYIIAAILIIKTDLIKQAQELMRIKSVEEQIKDEIEQEKLKEKEEQEKKETEKKDNKETEPKPKTELKESGQEPDGSEI